jgi:hypothetical protein
MSTSFWSPKLAKAIRHAIREARLAYEIAPGRYTMGPLNVCACRRAGVSARDYERTTHLDHRYDGGA